MKKTRISATLLALVLALSTGACERVEREPGRDLEEAGREAADRLERVAEDAAAAAGEAAGRVQRAAEGAAAEVREQVRDTTTP